MLSEIRSCALFALAIAAVCAGCTSDSAIPRGRIGALPFPGMMTLYCTADPHHLGRHRYAQAPRLFQTDEEERGIIYTARGGFLDVAHLRAAIDWTRYDTLQIRRALESNKTHLALPGNRNAVLNVTLNYPPD